MRARSTPSCVGADLAEPKGDGRFNKTTNTQPVVLERVDVVLGPDELAQLLDPRGAEAGDGFEVVH